MEKDINMPYKMILTSEQLGKPPFARQNTQHHDCHFNIPVTDLRNKNKTWGVATYFLYLLSSEITFSFLM